MRWRRRRYIDWDTWEPAPFIKVDWSRHRLGDRLPPPPLWLLQDRRGRPKMDFDTEYFAMPWWDQVRYDLTSWDPRDYSKFPPEFEIRRPWKPSRRPQGGGSVDGGGA